MHLHAFHAAIHLPRLEGLKFSAAHFVAFDGFREPMHGHNYTVAAQIGAQSLQHDGYVVDFGDVKKVLRTICRRLGIPKASETSWVGLKKSVACVPILILDYLFCRDIHVPCSKQKVE